MKKNYLILVTAFLFLVCIQTVKSQPISGTKTIPGDYATLTAAITALNTNGVGTGGVTFNIAAGYTESIADSLKLSATGTVSNTIVFQKNPTTTGANPLITRTDAGVLVTSSQFGNGDAVITIEGSDFVTFNGINVSTNDRGIEYGYYIRKVSGVDACKNVTIKNCTVTMTKGTPINRLGVGIMISNNIISSSVSSALGVTVTSEDGRHENIVITGDSVLNTFCSISQRGFNHTASPFNFYDQNITIGAEGAGNVLHNYGGDASRAEAVHTYYGNNVNISYNDISNAANGGTGFNSFGNAILLNTAKASQITVSYNTISLTSLVGCTRYMVGIYCNTGDTSSTLNIHHNIFQNCSHGSTGEFCAISNGVNGIRFNVYSNVINNNTVINGSTYIFDIGSPKVANIYDNTISNIDFQNTKSPNFLIDIGSPGAANVYGNTITNIMNTSDTASAGNIVCINFAGGTNSNIHRNKISGISGKVQMIYGIRIGGGTATYIYNNVISDLKSSLISNADAVRGINIVSATTSSTVGVYYNTIYFNDTLSTGADYGTTCIYHTYNTTATTSALDMRNNIFINKSKPNGTGKTVAFRRSGAGDFNNINISNNNCFYAGIPDSNRLIFSDGTNNSQTLLAYKTLLAPKDSASISENTPFTNTNTPPYDLHISGSSQCENGGLPVTTPISITIDCDSVLRNTTTPDLGAYEIIVSGVIKYVNCPHNFKLEQNYPNPFNPVTRINYELPGNSVVSLLVYDVTGKEISKIINGEFKTAGYHSVEFRSSNFASGVYFYRMIANSNGKEVSFTKKMVILK
jgi:hypothetical protein